MNDAITTKIIERIQKLLALAANNPNENEASLAAEKAQELLEAYNLDMATVGAAAPAGSDKREKSKLKGGLYKWQRTLWQAVAEQHYCVYWSIRGLVKGSTYEHRIVGRQVNVLATKLLAEYLQEAIERVTREEHCYGDPKLYFTKSAIAFREGMTDRIAQRLWDRRWEKEREARRQQREAQRSGTTGTALTLLDVKQQEADLNEDFLYGLEPGTTSQRRAKADADFQLYLERLQKEQEAAKEAEAKDRAENPEKWAKIDAEAERERKREERNARRRKGPRYREEKPRHHAYWDGRGAGDSVSLDQQVGQGQKRRQITG